MKLSMQNSLDDKHTGIYICNIKTEKQLNIALENLHKCDVYLRPDEVEYAFRALQNGEPKYRSITLDIQQAGVNADYLQMASYFNLKIEALKANKNYIIIELEDSDYV